MVARCLPLGALLSSGSACLATHLEIHPAFGGEAGHFAQEIRVAALLHELSWVHHQIGHSVAVRASQSDAPRGGVIPR